MHNPEAFWSDVLSEDPTRIHSAIESISSEEREAVISHLERMANEPGWLEGQQRRAQFALKVLEGRSVDNGQ
ncbi:MAG: hypothetical protein GTO18_08475 [Anaerolineales bacterium]|nr:hypothetical protein [Anaerolineales bacterium]